MGTDIDFYAEQRQPDGSWVLVGGLMKWVKYHLPHPANNDSPESTSSSSLLMIPIEQNYALFAILANVRNGAWPGCGADLEYISLPRGLPEDLSPELRECTDYWDDDLLCPTWLLLEEILSFPWKEKMVLQEAMVDIRAAPLFGYQPPLSSGHEWQPPETPRMGFPEEWQKGTPIGNQSDLPDGVRVQWRMTYETLVGNFLELLKPLQDFGDPAEIRLVFWFD